MTSVENLSNVLELICTLTTFLTCGSCPSFLLEIDRLFLAASFFVDWCILCLYLLKLKALILNLVPHSLISHPPTLPLSQREVPRVCCVRHSDVLLG